MPLEVVYHIFMPSASPFNGKKDSTDCKADCPEVRSLYLDLDLSATPEVRYPWSLTALTAYTIL